jgi:threonine aldolase
MEAPMSTPVVDLRSDTVTRPTPAMWQAMQQAPLGDDVFGDDPTVQQLEARVAQLLGKDAALWVPTGVMSNQIALRLHARPAEEIIVHAASHLHNHEQGAAAALSGLTLRTIDSPDGTLPLPALTAALRLTDDPHVAPTRAVAFENTHNGCGGCVVPQAHVVAVAALARRHGLGVHLDGARMVNAHVASGLSLAELAAPFDTVSLCLSKGLGAPMGSVLAMPAAMLRAARRHRKLLGGGARQVGVVAAAGLYALEHHVERLTDDHRRARHLAEGLAALGFEVDLARVQTNLVYFGLPAEYHATASATALLAHLRNSGVLMTASGPRLRAVTHLDVDDAGIERALAAAADGLRRLPT